MAEQSVTDLSEKLADLDPEVAAKLLAAAESPVPAQSDPVPVSDVVRYGKDGRVIYPESYKVYADRFGNSPRTIRSWVDKGRKLDPPDLPPLHDPCELAFWIRVHSEHKVPEKIEALAVDAQKNGREVPFELAGEKKTTSSLKNFSADSVGNPLASEDIGESLILGVTGGMDGDAGLIQARSLVAFCWTELEKAMKAGVKSSQERWLKSWRESVQILRAWEKDINKILEDRGELLRKSTLVAELVELAASIGRNDLNSRVDLVAMVVNLPDEELGRLRHSVKEQRKLALANRDESYRALRHTEFSAGFIEGAISAEEPEVPDV